jgi:hypothetical protein
MKRISFIISVIFCLVVCMSCASFAQSLSPESGNNNDSIGTLLPNFGEVSTGETDSGYGSEAPALGPLGSASGVVIDVPGKANNVVDAMRQGTGSSALTNVVSSTSISPLGMSLNSLCLTDPSLCAGTGSATSIAQGANANNNMILNRGQGSVGGHAGSSDDSETIGKIAWLSWEQCIAQEKAKKDEDQFNLLDAYAACGGAAIQKGYTFENDPRWLESKEILTNSYYLDDNGNEKKADASGKFMRLSQFLFARNLVMKAPASGAKISKMAQVQKDAMETFSAFIGDLMYEIVVDDKSTVLRRWNMDQFTMGSSTTPIKLQSRHTWVYNRTKELFDALINGMYFECVGGVTIGSDGSTLSNSILDKNPFEMTGPDAYQAAIDAQKEYVYKNKLKVAGYLVKADTIKRLFLLWLSRRSKNPLNPECSTLNPWDDSTQLAYAQPQKAEFGIYDTNPSPKIDDPVAKQERDKAMAEYAAWSKANINFVNPEERRLLLTLSYNLAATDYYGQLIAAYNFVKKVPSSGSISGHLRSAGFSLILAQAGAENLADINEKMVKHLKAIEEVTRQLSGDFK